MLINVNEECIKIIADNLAVVRKKNNENYRLSFNRKNGPEKVKPFLKEETDFPVDGEYFKNFLLTKSKLLDD